MHHKNISRDQFKEPAGICMAVIRALRIKAFIHLLRPTAFLRSDCGAIAPIFALLLLPLAFAMMLAIDTGNLMRTKNNVQRSLDASALAVGKRYVLGSTQAEMRDFGQKVFNANLSALQPEKAVYMLDFPQTADINQQITASADFTYTSIWGRAVKSLTKDQVDWDIHKYHFIAVVRLKNTLEVALVLDNSGSMTEKGSGSNKERMVLLKDAAQNLVRNLAEQAALITHLERPVQFSVVPFAGSVNVGADNADKPWMDLTGVSPVHYENFTMPTQTQPTTIATNKRIILQNGRYIKDGTAWGTENGETFTRFSLYRDMKSTSKNSKLYTNWQGCVEARPGDFGINAAPPSLARPETMYVPMFAPDEFDPVSSVKALNSWWTDNTTLTGVTNRTTTAAYLARQKDITKYYLYSSTGIEDTTSNNYRIGPNYSCTTTPITPLTDVTTTNGMKKITSAITNMVPNGGTNVPEGMVWGWRTLVEDAPFSGARPSSERGNDKVVIVLTDGANTYYQYSGLGNPDGRSTTDRPGNVSYYSNLGYTAVKTLGYTVTRIFQATSGVNTGTFTNANYTTALNARFTKLCELAKKDKIMIMTVALDLKESAAADKQQIAIMKECASGSRVRRDPQDITKPAKLFWNTTGQNLEQTFREIADELSNLRVVG